MDLAINFILNKHFNPNSESRTTIIGKGREETDIDVEQQLPTGIMQIQPYIIYLPKVERSFYRLETARKKYTTKSEERILKRVSIKDPEI